MIGPLIQCVCLREFKSSHGLRIHQLSCAEKQTIDELEREPYHPLHLTFEDAWGKSPDHAAIVHKNNEKRTMRKREERFHRSCLRAQGKAKIKRAKRHGWIPKNDVRHLGGNQA